MSDKKSQCTVVWNGAAVEKVMKDIMLDALLDTGELIAKKGQDYAPHNLGVLRSSGRVTVGSPPDPDAVYREAEAAPESRSSHRPDAVNSDGPTVFVTFSTPYARRLHEDTSWKPSDVARGAAGQTMKNRKGKIVRKKAVGGPKYLEKAAEDVWPQFNKILALVVKRRGALR